MRIFLNDLKISFIWKSVIFANTQTNHITYDKQTKEQPKTREPKGDSCRFTLPDNAKFYVWWCTGDWWVSCRKLRTEPKPKKKNIEPEPEAEAEQTNHHGPLICDMWGEFPKCVTRIRMGKSLWARVLSLSGSRRGILIWVRKYLSGFGNLSEFSNFPFGIIWYSMVWCGMVWFAMEHGYLPTISSTMSHRWEQSKSYHFDKQKHREEYATWGFQLSHDEST